MVNTPPIIDRNLGLPLDEATEATILSSHLRIEDADQDTITYTVKDLPEHGTLKLNGIDLNSSHNTFTQADIDSNRLTYIHNGTKTTSDGFSFTATDGQGGNIGDTLFSIKINPYNHIPREIKLSSNIVAENSANGTVIADLSTIDLNAEDSHTYKLLDDLGGRIFIDGTKLKVTNGSLFDFETTQSYQISLQSTDNGTPAKSSSWKTLTLTVGDVNEAPTVVQSLDNQNTSVGVSVNYQLDANTFADIDIGETLTYKATLANGEPLPSWLSFDATTRTFSGTPTNANVGNLDLLVTATDKGGLSASAPLNLTVKNDAPVYNNAQYSLYRQGVQWTRNPELSKTLKFTFHENTFTDPNPGDSLTYSALWHNREGGVGKFQALPETIKFDPATRTFTIDPSMQGDNWIKVTATDKSGASTEGWFHIYRDGCHIAIDNYISGGTAFFDADKDGVKDAAELFAITNEKGEFELNPSLEKFDKNQNGILDPSEGRIIVTGGTDVATGLPLETPITATPNSFVVTMLTSVVADLVDRGLTEEEAQTKVKAALSLPSLFDIGDLDPVSATNNNEPGGAKLFLETIKTQSTVTQIASLLDGASAASMSELTSAAVGAIASQIQTGNPLDLTASATLETLISDAVTKAKQIDPNLGDKTVLNIAQKASQIIAQSNQSIDDVVASNPRTGITSEVARAQLITLGEIPKDLFEVTAGVKTIGNAIAQNTGEALENQILAVKTGGETINGSSNSDTLNGGIGSDSINGGTGADVLRGDESFDSLTGGGGQDTFIIRAGDGTDTITDFGGVGKGTRPTSAVLAEVDTLKFEGAGLTAENLLAYQKGTDLVLTFDSVSSPRVILKNLTLENLDNLLKSTGASVDVGNILFDGETQIKDNFDAIDANQQIGTVSVRNKVRFLNDLNNNNVGVENSNDVFNGMGGNDTLTGLSGNDILRGGDGDDLLNGGVGKDTLMGGSGRDRFILAAGKGTDLIADFGDGIDTLLLTGGLTFQQLSITASAGATNISIASSGELLASLNGVDTNSIGVNDFALI